ELGLQRRGVGHGERRAVDQEGAMAAPAADRLSVGIQAPTIWRSRARKTVRGSRARAWQKALAEKARPAKSETWVKAVLPFRIWMRNQWIIAAGVNKQESHQVCPAARQAARMTSSPSRAARSCRSFWRVVEIR